MPNFDEYDNVNKYGYSDDGYKSAQRTRTTQDDWKPNFPGNKIKIKASLRKSVDVYIVYFCAIGASNYRLDVEFQTTIQRLADEKYKYWCDLLDEFPDEVNKDMFKDIGMTEKEV